MHHPSCPRCGCSAERPNRSWSDRHPAAAVTAALFSLTLMAMMLSVHPVAALAVIAVTAVGVAAWLLDRERDRRAAVAERADAANRELMRLMNAPRPIRLVPSTEPHPRHVMNRWPTTPMATQPIAR